MNKTTIYFIRHGEVHNPGKVLYGRIGRFRLSQKGVESITKAAAYFGTKKIEVMYSSPMLRARQTAGILSAVTGVKPRISVLLNEVKLKFQGMSLIEYKQNIQPYLYTEKFKVAGQESYEEIAARMKRFLSMAVKKHHGKSILAVSHGDPILILKTELLNLPFTWEYKRDHYLQPGQWITLTSENNKFSLIQ